MLKLVALIARHWPFANGSGRLLDLFARDVDGGDRQLIARTSDGFNLNVIASDLIGRHLLLSGKFDRSIVQILLDRARPGDVLLDVGANIGYVTACFLNQVPGSTAICVEPQPEITDLLRSNLAQFGTRSTIHEVALSDRSGSLSFHIDPANRGASRISAAGELTISAVDASELLRAIPRIDLIKIDVEGHELSVLTAMAAELERLRPRGILFEDQTDTAAPEGAIGSLLAGLGFEIFGIRKGLFKTSLVPVRHSADCRYNDYLAVSH